MTRTLLGLSGICLLMIAAVWFSHTPHTTSQSSAIVSPGNEQEVSAFALYDYERLRDPATNQIPPGIRERELAYAATLPSTSDMHSALLRRAQPQEQQIILSNLHTYGIEQTGGRTRALAIDVTNPSILLAGAVSGGVWRSTDAGASWSKTTKNSDGHSVSCIVQDKRKGKEHIWYYGTGEVLGTGGYPIYNYDIGEGIYSSKDSGKSWTKLPSTSVTQGKGPRSPFSLITELAVDNHELLKDVIYCAGAGSIQRSEDGGNTWTTVLGSATTFTASLAQVVVMPDGVVYASLGTSGPNAGGFYRSADGKNFTKLAISGLPSFSRLVLAPSPSEPNTLWLLAHSNANVSLWRYNYRSGDGSGDGGSWYQAPNSSLSSLINTLNGYCQALAVHPTNPNTLVVGGQDLYISTDKGETFSQIGGYQEGILQGREFDPTLPSTWLHPHHHPDIHALLFHPTNPDILYNGNDGGVYRTKNFGEKAIWESLNNGYKVGQFYSIDIDRRGLDKTAFVAGAQDNNAVVGRAGLSETMKWVLSGDGLYCAMPSGGKTFFPATQMGQVYRVDFNANNDSIINWTNLAPSINMNFFARAETSLSNDSLMFLLDRTMLWANSNVFEIPVSKSRQPTTMNWSVLPIQTTAVMTVLGQCASDVDRLYIGTNNGGIIRVNRLWEQDREVKEIHPANFHPLGYVSCIHVDRKDANRLLVAMSNYSLRSIFYSTDGGETFTDVSGNLEPPVPDDFYAGPSVRWIESQRTPNGMIYYAGTSAGLFYTTKLNGDQTQWVRIDEVGAVIVNMLKVRDEDGFVAVATHGLGVFTFNAALTPGQVSVQDTEPAQSFCSQVAPNPSAGDFQLTLALDIASPQSLRVVDSHGRTVHEQSISGKAGDVLQLSLGHLPSGAYFALLKQPKKGRAYLLQKLVLL